jgi:hypothetical protein
LLPHPTCLLKSLWYLFIMARTSGSTNNKGHKAGGSRVGAGRKKKEKIPQPEATEKRVDTVPVQPDLPMKSPPEMDFGTFHASP